MQIRTANLIARLSRDTADIDLCRTLRRKAFAPEKNDGDRHDDICDHILVETTEDQEILGCLRARVFDPGNVISSGYSAQHYDLSRLFSYPRPMLELGRFCVDSGPWAADTIRLIWAMVARLVRCHDIGLIFGCTSFPGTVPAQHQAAFDLLAAHHLAPPQWMPGAQAPFTIRLLPQSRQVQDGPCAANTMPALMRSYLALGGWVSDHGVIDHHLDTIHFFTGVEVAKIPARRAQRLYQLAA